MRDEFQADLRWCPSCRAYVHYLLSLELAFCASCGDKVKLFNDKDLAAFRAEVRAERTRARELWETERDIA